jgi:hypothetical protein
MALKHRSQSCGQTPSSRNDPKPLPFHPNQQRRTRRNSIFVSGPRNYCTKAKTTLFVVKDAAEPRVSEKCSVGTRPTKFAEFQETVMTICLWCSLIYVSSLLPTSRKMCNDSGGESNLLYRRLVNVKGANWPPSHPSDGQLATA